MIKCALCFAETSGGVVWVPVDGQSCEDWVSFCCVFKKVLRITQSDLDKSAVREIGTVSR